MPPVIPAGHAARPFHGWRVVRGVRPTSRGAPGLFAGLVAVGVSGTAVGPLAAQEPGSGTAPVATPAETRGTGRGPLDLSIGVRGGTLGYGAEIGKLVASHLGVRVAAYVFSYAGQQGLEDVQYDASVKFRHATALVDLFPGRRGRFHLTGGVVAGTSEVAGRGVPEGDTFYLNGREYTSVQVGALTGAVRFPRLRPYGGSAGARRRRTAAGSASRPTSASPTARPRPCSRRATLARTRSCRLTSRPSALRRRRRSTSTRSSTRS